MKKPNVSHCDDGCVASTHSKIVYLNYNEVLSRKHLFFTKLKLIYQRFQIIRFTLNFTSSIPFPLEFKN